MKKSYTFALIFLFCIDAYSQNFLVEISGGTLWDHGFNNFMYQRSTYAYTHTYNHTQFGILASANLYKRFNLVSGYSFARRYLEVNLFSKNPVNSFSGTKVYSHSIPLLIEYKFEPKQFPDKYLLIRAGGGISFNNLEYHTFGLYNQENALTVTYKYGLFYTVYPPSNPIPFLQGYLGFGDKIGKYGNISIGIGYKLHLSSYTYEMYYYFDNNADSSPATEETFNLSKQITELSINVAYSFGFKNKKTLKNQMN